MENWRVDLIVEVKNPCSSEICCHHYSSLKQWCNSTSYLGNILGWSNNFSKSRENINHLTYIDDIKVFAKNEKELENMIQTIRIYSQDIGMEFGIKRCALLIMKSGKKESAEEYIKTLGEKET